MTSTVTVPLMIVLFGLMGISVDSGDVGTTLEDVICNVDSSSIACGGLEFEKLKSTVLSSDIGDVYITNEHIAAADKMSVTDFVIDSQFALETEARQAAIEWAWDNLYNEPIISATDICDSNGNYVRFQYVFDEEYYNKWGNEQYIITAYTYTADGTCIAVNDKLINGSRGAFSRDGVIASQSVSYYDSETGIYYIGASDGTLKGYYVNVADLLDVSPEQLAATETIIDGAVGGVEIGEEDIAIIGATPIDLTTITGEEAAELATDIINAETLSDTTTDSTTTAPNYFNILEAIRNLLNGIKTGVSNILTNIKNIPANIIKASQTSVQASLNSISVYQNQLSTKLGLDAAKTNINIVGSAFFGNRIFNDKGEVIIEPVLNSENETVTEAPHLYFTLFNKEYDLFEKLYLFNDGIEVFKKIVSAFLIANFVLAFIRSLPSIIGGVGEVVATTNPTAITNIFESANIHRADVEDSRLTAPSVAQRREESKEKFKTFIKAIKERDK